MNTPTSDQIKALTAALTARHLDAPPPGRRAPHVPPSDEDVVATGADDDKGDTLPLTEDAAPTSASPPDLSVDGNDSGPTAGAEMAGAKADEPSCRQVYSDGKEEDCNQSAVWPWMIAGAGLLLAGAAGAGGRNSDSLARTDAAPTPPPAPAPAPEPAPAPGPAPAPAPGPAPAPEPPAPPPLLAAPRLSTSTGKDTIGGAGHVDVALAAPGTSWVYRVDGDTTWHAGQGDSIDAGTLNRGVHAVMVAQVDDQGRPGEVATLAVRVHDDMLAPGLALAHDNGSSSTDGLTNDGTITVAGLAAGATWFYRVNGATEWTQGKDGQVPANALVAGQNRIEAYQVDAGGERSPLTGLTVTLDLSPPEAPLLQTSNGTDLLNAKDFINVSGIEGGASWKFRVNGQGDWIEGHDGRIPAAALADGENHVEVVQVDAAGNAGAAATLTVRQDLEAPDPLQAHVEGGRGNLVSLQGSIAIDNIEDGATWKYRINGESDWHVGSGSQLSANYLLEGRNDVTLMQTDSTGHDSAATAITVTRDSLAPDRPDLVTSNGLPLINAQGSLLVHHLEDATTWEYRIDGGDWLAGNGDSIGVAALHQGNQTVDVRQSDLAGNVSEIGTMNVTLDATPPDAVMSEARTHDGAVATNHLINATGYLSIDNLEQGGTWQFKVNGDHWRDGGGQQLPTRVLDEGANTIEFRQIDAAGNVSEPSTAQVTLDATAPDSPALSSSTGKWLMSASGMILINGIEPDAQLTVKVDGSVAAGMTTTADGASFQGFRFGGGNHSVEAYVTDAAGNVSRSAVVSYTVDVISPDAPQLYLSDGRINDLSDHVDVLNLEQGATWWYRVDGKGDWIQGSGTSIPGSAFENPVDTSDPWSTSHLVKVYQVDAAGNESIPASLALWSDVAASPPPAGI